MCDLQYQNIKTANLSVSAQLITVNILRCGQTLFLWGCSLEWNYRDGTLIRQGALNSSIYKTLPITVASSSAELNASKYDETMSKKNENVYIGRPFVT